MSTNALRYCKRLRERLDADIRFFEKYMRPDKVYLEPFRGIMADHDHVQLYRKDGETVFESRIQPGVFEVYRIEK